MLANLRCIEGEVPKYCPPNCAIIVQADPIFSRQASLARQAFLITPLHGARLKTGKNAYAKK